MIIYTIEEFQCDMDRLADKIKATEVWRHIKDVYGIPRGGLGIALWLSHRLNRPIILGESEITERTLVVDDLIHTGRQIRRHNLTAVIFYNSASGIEPTFWVRAKLEGWILFPWETLTTTKTKEQEEYYKDK